MFVINFYSANGIRGILKLPFSINSDARILVLAPPDMHEAAQKAGAAIVGGQDLVFDILAGKLDFNRCIATPDMMPVLTKIARYLGPLGLMPTLKNGTRTQPFRMPLLIICWIFVGTLTKNLEEAINAALSNIPFKVDKKGGLMHIRVGLVSKFSASELERNIVTVLQNIQPYGKTNKGGKFIETAHISISSEPSIRVDPACIAEKQQ